MSAHFLEDWQLLWYSNVCYSLFLSNYLVCICIQCLYTSQSVTQTSQCHWLTTFMNTVSGVNKDLTVMVKVFLNYIRSRTKKPFFVGWDRVAYLQQIRVFICNKIWYSKHEILCHYVSGIFSFDYVDSQFMKSNSILELIHSTMIKSRNKEVQYFVRARGPAEAPIPVNILYPISRDNLVHSLMHNARHVIRRQVRFDHIDKLHIPTSLKNYLKDAQYYYEESDTPLPVCDVTRPPLPPPLPAGPRPSGPPT